MITSWQIVIDSYPKLNDLVTTRTWAYRFHAFEGDRNHTMKNEKGAFFLMPTRAGSFMIWNSGVQSVCAES